MLISNTFPTWERLMCRPPSAPGIAPTTAPIPKPLSRTQLEIAMLPIPPDPAVAASVVNRTMSIPGGQ